MMSERTRVADLGQLASYEPQAVRGTTDNPLSARLDRAFDEAAAARRSTLGLFPTYDTAALDVVADSLVSIRASARPETSVAQEARLALGRIRLQQGRDAEAARILGALVREGNYVAADARRLLDVLR